MAITNQFLILSCSNCIHPIGYAVPNDHTEDASVIICPKCGQEQIAVPDYDDSMTLGRYVLMPYKANSQRDENKTTKNEWVKLPRF